MEIKQFHDCTHELRVTLNVHRMIRHWSRDKIDIYNLETNDDDSNKSMTNKSMKHVPALASVTRMMVVRKKKFWLIKCLVMRLIF
jgi:hypothetical protein